MKITGLRFLILFVLVALVATVFPMQVFAAQVTVLSITPNSIVNNVPNNITVAGSGFDSSAAVLLDGSALSTSFLNDQTLTASVPAGISPGVHVITVSMTGGPATGSANLTVSSPTPVPPTLTPTPTSGPLPFVRPQLVVKSSKVSGNVVGNGEFKVNVVMDNAGTSTAYNVQAVFSSADLLPLKNGGIGVLGNVFAGNKSEVSQSFLVTGQTYGKSMIALDMNVTYYDSDGASYTDKFTLSIPVSGGGTGSVVYPTSTPTGVKASQLVITGYDISLDTLQPGDQFTLTLTVKNVGNAGAQRITMIVGGGSSGGSGGNSDGTPQPGGGVSGGSGEFSNFAPVGASNVQSLGDLSASGSTQAAQNLIVNLSTNPGAYPMKVTFSYLNDKNEVINDEQVITLLVYSLPKVDVSFYRPLDMFFAGQPGALPIQVVNLGKRVSVLGNINVTAENGMVENGTSLVGSLDAGGYFTLDSMLIPEQSGKLTLTFTIDYSDDFNLARTITKTVDIEVMEAMQEPIIDPSAGDGGMNVDYPMGGEETVLQKIWRFIRGLFGLDSAPPSGDGSMEPGPIIEPGMGQG